jgi:hypothetical protein
MVLLTNLQEVAEVSLVRERVVLAEPVRLAELLE